jgi:hypothetical protein
VCVCVCDMQSLLSPPKSTMFVWCVCVCVGGGGVLCWGGLCDAFSFPARYRIQSREKGGEGGERGGGRGREGGREEKKN